MSKTKEETIEMDIKEFDYYLVFMDSNANYVISYGYETRPAVIDIKYAFEQVANEPDLVAAIPDWKTQLDYVSIETMNHKKFVKYMVEQEKKAKKVEKKAKKKK